MGGVIREVRADDVHRIAELAARMRERYEHYEPRFWRVAEGATEIHELWLAHLLDDERTLALVAEDDGEVVGYLFATVAIAPPVYDPGPSATIDDFAVTRDAMWAGVGVDLLREAQRRLGQRGVGQVVVVCGHRDEPKRAMLQGMGLHLASEWYVGTAPS